MNRNAGRHCVAEHSARLHKHFRAAIPKVLGVVNLVEYPRKQRIKWA
jgi:hypothetical protein